MKIYEKSHKKLKTFNKSNFEMKCFDAAVMI